MRKLALVRGAALTVAAVMSGCAWVGPEIVRSGRPAYNDAILTTSDQQLLQNIVRMRFVDSIGFLAVSSVTANVSVSATGGVQLGFGSESNYSGNLVPFTGTLRAEQNPTISYTPVAADHLLRQFAAAVPLDLAILMVNSAHSHAHAWWAIVRRVNNLRNPDFPDPPTLIVDPRFKEVAELAGTLQQRGSLYWARLDGAQKGHAVVLHSYSPVLSREVARLLELLGIERPAREGDDIVIPVQLGRHARAGHHLDRDAHAARSHAPRGRQHRPADGHVRRGPVSSDGPGRPGNPHPLLDRGAVPPPCRRAIPRSLVLDCRRRRREQAVVQHAAGARCGAVAGWLDRHGAGAHDSGLALNAA